MLPNESNYNNEKDYYRALEEYQYELYEYELKVNNLEVEIQNLYHDIAHDTQDMVLLNNLLDKLSKEFYEELF